MTAVVCCLMRVMLITNPFATSTTQEGRDTLARALEERHQVDVVPTTHRGHAGELGVQAAEEGFDAVVVHGGDGSVNELVNGMLGAPEREDSSQRPDPSSLPAVGVVPGGNANVFARSLGVNRKSDAAVKQVLAGLDAGMRRRISLAHTLNRWFLFNAGMGMDAIVVRKVDEARNDGKPVTNLRYVSAALSSFFSKDDPSPTFQVELPDGQTVDGARFGFVSNTGPWTYLGPKAIRTNPGTDFDSGLGLFAATSLSALPNLGLGAQLLAGSDNPHAKHLYRDDDVEWLRFTADAPADIQMDGEYLGKYQSLDFACVPGVLDVIV